LHGYFRRIASHTHLQGVKVKYTDFGIRYPGTFDMGETVERAKKVLNGASISVFNSDIEAVHRLFLFVYTRVAFPSNKLSFMKKFSKTEGFGKRFKKITTAKAADFLDNPDKREALKALLELATYPLVTDHEITAGPFKIQNPTNLPRQDVETAQKVIAKLAKYATNDVIPNFTKVLYGDVILSPPLAASGVLATYDPSLDFITFYTHKTLFGGKIGLRTLLHELGHRYYRTMEAPKKMEWAQWHIQALKGGSGAANFEANKTAMLGVQVKASFVVNDDPRPSAPPSFIQALSFVGKGKLYYIVSASTAEQTNPGCTRRILSSRDYEGKGMDNTYGIVQNNKLGGFFHPISTRELDRLTRMAIELTLIEGAIDRGLLPTRYARTNSEEHFCEALSFRAVGDLPEIMSEKFEMIFFGSRKHLVVPSETELTVDIPTPTAPIAPTAPTEVSAAVGSKSEMDKKGNGLAQGLGLSYVSGRKYGTFVYTNNETLSTHAYMFLDYASGNLFVPKTKAFPNLDVNIANLLDKDVADATSFTRMSKLRPKWRTQATIEEGIAPAHDPQTPVVPDLTPQVSDQEMEPDLPQPPEQVSVDVVTASTNAAKLLGMSAEVLRKYVRIRYLNEQLGDPHAYLFVAKSDGAIYTPKAGHQASTEMIGNIFEPNIISKILPTSLYKNDKWKTKFTIVETV